MRNGGDDVCPSQRKSHEHDEKVNHDEKEVIFPRPVNLTSIWKNDYRDCTQYHHQGKKKKTCFGNIGSIYSPTGNQASERSYTYGFDISTAYPIQDPGGTEHFSLSKARHYCLQATRRSQRDI
jgi:hypothetical protein